MSKEVTKALQQVIAGDGASTIGPNFTMQKVIGVAVNAQELREIQRATEDEQHEFQMNLVKKFHARVSSLFRHA